MKQQLNSNFDLFHKVSNLLHHLIKSLIDSIPFFTILKNSKKHFLGLPFKERNKH